jgi:hypothetical protein
MRDTGRDAFGADAVDLNGPALWVGPESELGPATGAQLAAALPERTGDLQLACCALPDLPALCTAARLPRLVAAPLFWPEGDVIDTLRVLSLLGYPGPVRVVAPPLPRPEIVRRELRADAPGLDIEIVELPPG